MRYLIFILFFILGSISMFGQNETVLLKGTVSYVSSQNVYVKYASTEGIEQGDTLFSQKGNLLKPCLVVKDKSSTSCVCTSLLTEQLKVGDEFFARVPKKEASQQPTKKAKEEAAKAAQDSLLKNKPVVVTPESEEKPEPDFKQKIKGRLSAASYGNFYGGDATHRMRYAFTMQGNNIGDSRFSADSYITFRHTWGEWSEVKANFNDALKIYSLSVKYDLDKKSSITLGRKINQRISSMGAIDGLQVEKGFGNFLVGGIAGSRPKFTDYSFDPNLLQAGVYVGHAANSNGRISQSTLAFVEQRNGGATDRRFVYFQHSNMLRKDLSMFGSMEIDLYENVNNEAKNTLSLTNLYFTLRYRVSKKISLSASYDNRKNIIYYESYKSYIDQLIDDETRQGLRFNVNYRPFKFVTWGANVNWRFQKSDMNLSKNLNSYLNFSRIPWLKAYASLTVNVLQTNYLDSKMFGVRINKEMIPGKLNGEVYVRLANSNYKNTDYTLHQQLIGGDISFTLTRKLALHLYYEGTFDKQNDTYHRFNTKIIQRF